MNLRQKKVLVTGAEGALGSVVARYFLQMGAQVTGTYLREAPQENFDGIRWIQIDLTDAQSVQAKLSGKNYEILIHCAGGFRFGAVEETSEEDLKFLLNTNLLSAFHLCKALLPEMKTRNFGRFIFVSSATTLRPVAGMAPYLASKAGLNVLVSSLTEETKEYDITANAILPTTIDTPANRNAMPKATFSDWVPPAEIAEIMTSLVSPWGHSIRGSCIRIGK